MLEQIRAEWALVPKNASGRMDREIFVEHLLELHHEELMGAGTKQVYRQFLDRCFDAGVGLMLAPGKEEKADVGRHCFSYSLLLANEFYFKAAAAAEGASCPCATPVADQLALWPSHAHRKHVTARDQAMRAEVDDILFEPISHRSRVTYTSLQSLHTRTSVKPQAPSSHS